jgi:hypothetical protein
VHPKTVSVPFVLSNSLEIYNHSRVTTGVDGDTGELPLDQLLVVPIVVDVVMPLVVVVAVHARELARLGRQVGTGRLEHDLEGNRVVLRAGRGTFHGSGVVMQSGELVSDDVGACIFPIPWCSACLLTVSGTTEQCTHHQADRWAGRTSTVARSGS